MTHNCLQLIRTRKADEPLCPSSLTTTHSFVLETTIYDCEAWDRTGVSLQKLGIPPTIYMIANDKVSGYSFASSSYFKT